jgi:hypothetical protein
MADNNDSRLSAIWITAAVIAAVALVAGLLLLTEGSQLGSAGQNGATVKQAPWKITVYGAGARDLPKKKRKVSRARRREVSRVVRTVYNTAFLHPQRLRKTTRRYMTGAAARGFERLRIGADNAQDLRILWRTARIGVQARGARRAAALVRITARPGGGGKGTRSKTQSRLWMERTKRGWKVIAYDLDQRPLKREKPKAHKNPKKGPDRKTGERKSNRADEEGRGQSKRRNKDKRPGDDGARRDGGSRRGGGRK